MEIYGISQILFGDFYKLSRENIEFYITLNYEFIDENGDLIPSTDVNFGEIFDFLDIIYDRLKNKSFEHQCNNLPSNNNISINILNATLIELSIKGIRDRDIITVDYRNHEIVNKFLDCYPDLFYEKNIIQLKFVD
jgi:hypothetical protein